MKAAHVAERKVVVMGGKQVGGGEGGRPDHSSSWMI